MFFSDVHTFHWLWTLHVLNHRLLHVFVVHGFLKYLHDQTNQCLHQAKV